MKKLLLAMMLLVNSAFAITLAEINLQTHPRAMALQFDVMDPGKRAVKLNSVNYPYWTAGAPYLNLKYTGEVISWYYSHDYANFYSYSYPYVGYWDQYLNPTDLSLTYIYVDLAGYSIGQVDVKRTGALTVLPLVETLPDGTKVYLDTSSKAIKNYQIITHIQASDGTADLYNTLYIDRNIK